MPKWSWKDGGYTQGVYNVISELLGGTRCMAVTLMKTQEVRDDKEIECFYIEFESTIEKGRYDSSRGGFLSFSDAISEAEKVSNQKIDWKKKK